MTTNEILPAIQASRGSRTVHAGYELGGVWYAKCGQNQLRTIQGRVSYAPVEAPLSCPKCAAQREAALDVRKA